MIGVDEVQPDRGVLDARLVGPWIADADVFVHQDLGPAGLVETDSLCHVLLLRKYR